MQLKEIDEEGVWSLEKPVFAIYVLVIQMVGQAR
jgi:hypothetical protein